MCLGTINIKTDQGRINVPCGKCAECLQKRRTEWTFRLLAELRYSESASFVTLTYNDERLPQDGNLIKSDVQKFIKRLRKKQSKSTWKVRYYAIGEYGEKTGRPHYHLLLFNVKNSIIRDMDQIWTNGNIYIGTVNQASIHYVTKYMLNRDFSGKEVKQFSLMSTKPYIGNSYIDSKMVKYHKEIEPDKVNYQDGHQISMPKIYKSKIFNKLQRLRNADALIKKSDQEQVEQMEKFIKKRGEKAYAKRVKDVNQSKTRKMIKQSKSKIV